MTWILEASAKPIHPAVTNVSHCEEIIFVLIWHRITVDGQIDNTAAGYLNIAVDGVSQLAFSGATANSSTYANYWGVAGQTIGGDPPGGAEIYVDNIGVYTPASAGGLPILGAGN